jgi:SpoVK/Ycf46/Vps4 family AAA+-type ATPase
MPRSDLVKKMLESHQRGDESGFRATAEEIIADERRKRHDLLADELEGILRAESDEGVRPLQIASVKPLPKSRDDLPLLQLSRPSTTFGDIVLREDLSSPIRDITQEFRLGASLKANGLKPRDKLLFVGPPGCGKTRTAEAVAHELGIPMVRINLASVVSSFLGETSRNLQAIFNFCQVGSWVVFFDEFDSLTKERADAGEHGELKRVVTAFLQLMDDFSGDSLLVAATNHPRLLDSAVWRRFDEVLRFDMPTGPELERVLDLRLRSMRSDFSRRELARKLRGHAHADAERVCWDAMRRAIVDGRSVVSLSDIRYGLDRLAERERAVSSPTA